MQATPYSVLMSRVRAAGGEAQVEVPEDWLQGRTIFGGLQAAIALAAMRTLAPPAPLRTLQATFLAPVPGGTVRARARLLRSGRSATHIEGRLLDGDETLALVVGVFGFARESAVSLRPRRPQVREDGGIALPFASGTTPNFTQHFDARWLVGAPPFAGTANAENVIALGMRDEGKATQAHVVAMADFIPPVALSFLREPAAAASLTWMLELLADDVSALPLSGWRIDARMEAAGDGYTNQSLVLWGPGGVPVALGRQCMVVFG